MPQCLRPMDESPVLRFVLVAIALAFLGIVVGLPVVAVFVEALRKGFSAYTDGIMDPFALSAIRLTLLVAAIAVPFNLVFGVAASWAITKFEFTGKRLLTTLIDLPFSVSPVISGMIYVLLFGVHSALGAWLIDNGVEILFAVPGLVIATIFVTFPFVVRAVEPVLAGLDRSQEDAAASLGAGPFTIFRRIVLPPLLLPLSSGALLSFARAIGEFGAIVIVAGNIPLRSQTAAVYVLGEVESENRLGASAISIVMVALAFSLLLLVDWLQNRNRKEAA